MMSDKISYFLHRLPAVASVARVEEQPCKVLNAKISPSKRSTRALNPASVTTRPLFCPTLTRLPFHCPYGWDMRHGISEQYRGSTDRAPARACSLRCDYSAFPLAPPATSNHPSRHAPIQVTGAFAEFERSMIRQRVHAGLKRAVEAGKTLGRPRISEKLEKRIEDQLRAGKGILKVAHEVGVGHGTVERIARDMNRPFDAAATA
jgi:hypothetical protein